MEGRARYPETSVPVFCERRGSSLDDRAAVGHVVAGVDDHTVARLQPADDFGRKAVARADLDDPFDGDVIHDDEHGLAVRSLEQRTCRHGDYVLRFTDDDARLDAIAV